MSLYPIHSNKLLNKAQKRQAGLLVRTTSTQKKEALLQARILAKDTERSDVLKLIEMERIYGDLCTRRMKLTRARSKEI